MDLALQDSFRATKNGRAMRDMGLAAWFGGSLMNTLTMNAALRELPAERRADLLDTALRRSGPVYGAGIASYLVGTQLAREDTERGVSSLRTDGVESPVRAALAGVAVAAGVAQGALRKRIARTDREGFEADGTSDDRASHERNKKALKALQYLVPALTASLLYLHVREDVQAHH